MTPEDNAALIRRLHRELMESQDIGIVDGFFAPDFVSNNNPPGLPAGVAGVKAFFALFRDAIPDLELRIDDLVSDGEMVAVATTVSGTHRGSLMGIAETGKRVSMTGIDMVRIVDGKIVEHRGLSDIVGLMRQLGVGFDTR